MTTSKQSSLVGLATLLTLASVQACSGSDAPGSSNAAGAPGAHAGSAPIGGSTSSAGTAALGGSTSIAGSAPIGGSSPIGGSASIGGSTSLGTGGSVTGPSTAGAGGAGGASTGNTGGSIGSGGRGNGGSGGSSTGSGGGSSTASFANVTTIINGRCVGCHGGGQHVNLSADLYTALTTPIPMSAAHCKGTTLVVPGNAAGSFLVSIVKGMSTCKNNAANESIPRMPDRCNGNSCLSAAQVQTLTDWINAGASK